MAIISDAVNSTVVDPCVIRQMSEILMQRVPSKMVAQAIGLMAVEGHCLKYSKEYFEDVVLGLCMIDYTSRAEMAEVRGKLVVHHMGVLRSVIIQHGPLSTMIGDNSNSKVGLYIGGYIFSHNDCWYGNQAAVIDGLIYNSECRYWKEHFGVPEMSGFQYMLSPDEVKILSAKALEAGPQKYELISSLGVEEHLSVAMNNLNTTDDIRSFTSVWLREIHYRWVLRTQLDREQCFNEVIVMIKGGAKGFFLHLVNIVEDAEEMILYIRSHLGEDGICQMVGYDVDTSDHIIKHVCSIIKNAPRSRHFTHDVIDTDRISMVWKVAAEWVNRFGNEPMPTWVLWCRAPSFISVLKRRDLTRIKALIGEYGISDMMSDNIVFILYVLFRDRTPTILRVRQKVGGRYPVHNAGVHIDKSSVWPKAASDWAYARRDSKEWDLICRICNRWEPVVARAKGDLSIRTLEGLLYSMSYDGVSHCGLATQAAKAGIDEGDYPSIEKRWLNSLKVEPGNACYIPHIPVIEHEGYSGYVLDKDDPRGLFLGSLTDCCQYPGSVGETCAWHGQENNKGGFFVVEYKGQVLAQSWMWRNKNTLCFDNIETLGMCHDEVVFEVYKRAAKSFIGRLGIKKVVVGIGFNDLEPLSSLLKVKKPKGAPQGCYTDANEQRLFCKRSNDNERRSI